VKPSYTYYFRIMFRQFLNWRTLLAVVAIFIVSGTIWYSTYLAEKIKKEERRKVNEWIAASTSLLNPGNAHTDLAFMIIQNNKDIPIIETNEKDSITGGQNLDSAKISKDPSYLKSKLKQLKEEHPPIIWVDPLDSSRSNRYYYGHTQLLDEVTYYPYVQLFIVGLFILVTFLSLRSSYLSTQNQIWAGMAKETAHQLGTPVSSLEGWMEILKESHPNEPFVSEIGKDVSRLRLVTDRFGKIGSKPQLELYDIIAQIRNMVEYIRKRAGGKVSFDMDTHGAEKVFLKISAPLFDWVIENLLKNALDAMEGKGAITIDIHDQEKQVFIDITDTGKGISKQHVTKVFKPGFTTKKRGWGLGLSLSKRIIEQYHQGSLTVKQSEPGKGTTFRIVMIK
jgi:Histidine kinase-, DNA gyrase B-, and HSP90-like ATPase